MLWCNRHPHPPPERLSSCPRPQCPHKTTAPGLFPPKLLARPTLPSGCEPGCCGSHSGSTEPPASLGRLSSRSIHAVTHPNSLPKRGDHVSVPQGPTAFCSCVHLLSFCGDAASPGIQIFHSPMESPSSGMAGSEGHSVFHCFIYLKSRVTKRERQRKIFPSVHLFSKWCPMAGAG